MLTMGSDPEMFLTLGKKPVFPTTEWCQGTKERPQVLSKVTGHAVQIDGTALEANTCVVSTHSFNEEIERLRKRLNQFLPKGVTLADETTRIWDPEEWKKIPEAQKELGCNPDFNAYTLKENPRPDPESIGRPTMRTAGGHIHVGWSTFCHVNMGSEEHFLDCAIVTKVMDAFLMPMSKSWDKDEERAKLYGAPGAFRPKSFGVEYRPLSNKWFTHKHSYRITTYIQEVVHNVYALLFERVQYVPSFASSGFFESVLEAKSVDEVIEVLRKHGKGSGGPSYVNAYLPGHPVFTSTFKSFEKLTGETG